MWPAIAAATTALGGFLGQERTNRQNAKQARLNRQFQSREAGLQRSFQERMRNTQWQAGIEDMRAAGINPAIAYSQGGAAAPGGAAGSGAQATMENSVASALQLAQAKAGLELTRKQIEKAAGEAMSAKAQGRIDKERAAFMTPSHTISGMGQAGYMPLREQLAAQVATSIAEAQRARGTAGVADLAGSAASGFQEMMPGFQRIMSTAGKGASSVADVISLLERGARMRDAAVQQMFGFSKKTLMDFLNRLKAGRR